MNTGNYDSQMDQRDARLQRISGEDGLIDPETHVPLQRATTAAKRIRELEAQLAEVRDGWAKAVELSIDIRNQLKQAEEANDKLYKVNQRIAAELDRQNAVNTRLTAELGKALDRLTLQAKPVRGNIDENPMCACGHTKVWHFDQGCERCECKHFRKSANQDEIGDYGYMDATDSHRAAVDADIAASKAAGVKFTQRTPEQRAQAEAMQEKAD